MSFMDWFRPKKDKLVEAAGSTTSKSEEGWRRVGNNENVDRDLSPMSQIRMQRLALYMWERNILGNRIIELPLAFMLAEGVTVTASNEETQKWITDFWEDPINQMDIKLTKKVRQLAIFGEQCYTAFTNEMNGHVRLGYVDPANIAQVVRDPDNAEQPIGIITQRDKKGNYKKYRIIINGDESVFTQRTKAIREQFNDGECFYFAINDLSNGARGRSDLLHLMDWLDAYDKFLFDEIDRTELLRAFVWDVEIEGATAEECKERAASIAPPESGDVRVHNQKEKWSAVTPTLNAGDSATSARLLRNHVLSGSTLPEHWLGGAGDTNRATASEMGLPTFKIFTMRQTFIAYMLKEMIKFVIRQRSGESEPSWADEQFSFDVQMPEMINDDVAKYAQVLTNVVSFVSIVLNEGLITRTKALEIINSITSRMGIEIDAAVELDAALAEVQEIKEKQREDDNYTADDLDEAA